MDDQHSVPVSRRSFLWWTTAGWVVFVAALLVAVVAAIRMMFPNVRQQPPTPDEFEAGRISEIQTGAIVLRFTDHRVWLVGESDRVFALIAECTKDACVPSWKPDVQFFECPCCGSTFSKDGTIIQGPAPRALERAAVRLSTDGQILVDKSRRFRSESGEWNNPAASLRRTGG